jgi:uncharacterized protein YsxB (DUF464 family)
VVNSSGTLICAAASTCTAAEVAALTTIATAAAQVAAEAQATVVTRLTEYRNTIFTRAFQTGSFTEAQLNTLLAGVDTQISTASTKANQALVASGKPAKTFTAALTSGSGITVGTTGTTGTGTTGTGTTGTTGTL